MKERGMTGAGRPQTTGVPRVHRHLKLVRSTHGRGTSGTGNDILLGRTRVHHSGIRPLTPRTMNGPRQCGDGWGEVIPSFDGTDFSQADSSLCVPDTSGSGKLLERLEGRACDACEGIQALETTNSVVNLPDHLRIHFEPIEVSRRG